MNYYKIFQDNNFIGMITSDDFYEYNKYNQLFFPIKETLAQCIFYNNNIYRISGMQPLPGNFNYEYVQIFPTTETQYQEFKQALENNQSINITYPTEPEVISQPILQSQPQSEQVQSKMTIQQMRDKITEQEQQIQLLTDYILNL